MEYEHNVGTGIGRPTPGVNEGAAHHDHDERTCIRPYWAAKLTDTDFDLSQRGSFTVAASAAYLGVSERWGRQAIKRGIFPAKRIGKGDRIQKAHLDAILGAQEP